MKKILWGLGMVWLAGCGGASHYYILSTATQPLQTSMLKKSIGIERVMLPSYMDKRYLTVATSTNSITQLQNAVWAEDMDAGLTQRLVGFLQKRFQQPNVSIYPWGADRQPDVKIKVQISRFLAQGSSVYLDSSYVVTDIATKQSRAYLFSTSVATSSAPESIVSSMDKAFGALEADIAGKMR